MKTKLVRMGNSRGVRIPKPLLEQTGIEGEVIIEVKEGGIMIRPAKREPREGWEAAARAFVRAGGDDAEWEDWDSAALDEEWDKEGWTW